MHVCVCCSTMLARKAKGHAEEETSRVEDIGVSLVGPE